MQGLVLALFGACVGSFTNVVAWRLPRQESVVVPGSHWPRCGHAVRWHDNLPIFGWLLLLGRWGSKIMFELILSCNWNQMGSKSFDYPSAWGLLSRE